MEQNSARSMGGAGMLTNFHTRMSAFAGKYENSHWILIKTGDRDDRKSLLTIRISIYSATSSSVKH